MIGDDVSLASEYRRRAVEADGLAAQMESREAARRWRALADSWRELADAAEGGSAHGVIDGPWDGAQARRGIA
mgnify:CR=1 FL=1